MTIKQKNASVPQNVEQLIASRGLKKSFVAESAGMSGAALSDIIHGRRIVTAQDIANLAVVLGTTPGELFRA